MGPVNVLANASNLFWPIGAAMGLSGSGDLWRAIPNDGLDGEEDRLLLFLSPLQGGLDVFLVMTIHFAGDPARGFKPCALVGGVSDIDIAVNGD